MSGHSLRLSRLMIVPLSLALVALTVGAPLVAAKGGGDSANAKLCQQGGDDCAECPGITRRVRGGGGALSVEFVRQ